MPTELLEDGRVLAIRLGGSRGNILTTVLMEEISAALSQHQDRPALRMVFLRGQGGNFSYGASVPEHVRELAPAMLARFHALVRQIATFPVPIACLVEGRCLGGAFELALATQLCFATPGARLGCPEIKLGVFPPVLAALGAWRLGAARAERLILTGAEWSAAEAREAGLVAEIFASPDPEAELLAWYRAQLAPLSAHALRKATQVFRRASGLTEALATPLQAAEEAYLADMRASHDSQEGINAFLEKRAPVWLDR